MIFSIPCATFARLSAICTWMPDDRPQPYLRALYVERKAGRLIAIATNAKLAAIELVSATDIGPDAHCFLDFDAALVAQCRLESQFSSSLQVSVMDALQMTQCRTTLGYSHPTNVGIFPTDEPVRTLTWRTWLPDELPKASHGTMQIDCALLLQLCEASPSKQIIFPPFIDTRVPALMRDKIDPNWYGLFMPSHDTSERAPKLRLPTW